MTIYTEIEIAAAPDVVRETFLDFTNLPQWHSDLIAKITPVSEDADPLAEGKKLHAVIDGMSLEVTITTNTPAAFIWQGPPVLGIISGLHSFQFTPSSITSGGTTFVQKEDFSGLGKFLMHETMLGGKYKKLFQKFNEDLKRRVENPK